MPLGLSHLRLHSLLFLSTRPLHQRDARLRKTPPLPPPSPPPHRSVDAGSISLFGSPSLLHLRRWDLPARPRARSLWHRAGWLPRPHLAANADIKEYHGIDRAWICHRHASDPEAEVGSARFRRFYPPARPGGVYFRRRRRRRRRKRRGRPAPPPEALRLRRQTGRCVGGRGFLLFWQLVLPHLSLLERWVWRKSSAFFLLEVHGHPIHLDTVSAVQIILAQATGLGLGPSGSLSAFATKTYLKHRMCGFLPIFTSLEAHGSKNRVYIQSIKQPGI